MRPICAAVWLRSRLDSGDASLAEVTGKSDQRPNMQAVIRRTRELRAEFMAAHNDTSRPFDER